MEFRLLEPLQESDTKQLDDLRDFIKNLQNVCIAFSGGVDSSLVAAISAEQLGSKAIAITGISDSLAPYLRKEARQQAQWLRILHEECFTNEISDPNYKNNPENRCFACKRELHQHLKDIAKLSNGAKVVDGVNYDDLKEYRPGIEAAKKANVISPLAEVKITKTTVRTISKSLGLPWWDKPSQPCLASRVPYGEKITSQRLKQIAKAEEWLISEGFHEVRVRTQGLGARIEVPPNRIADLINHSNRKNIVKELISIGFTSISIDLEGLISGKLNRDRKIFKKVT